LEKLVKLKYLLFSASLGLLLCACNNANPVLECQPDTVQCNEACVLLESNKAHCGGCNLACAENQRCVDGQCRQLSCSEESFIYAACFGTGQVAVLSSCTQNRVALALVGDSPQALSGMGELLLCADTGAEQLLRLDAQTLKPVGEALPVGQNPIHVSASGTHVYVVNAGSNVLQVFDTQNNPSGAWQTQTLSFPPNRSPQSFALAGEWGFVPLYGNLVGGETRPGQRLVRIRLSNPARLSLEGEADFSSLPLPAFEGLRPVPFPYDVVFHQGAVYAALNNLSDNFANDWKIAGPGSIAKTNPSTLETTLLPPLECLNVVSLASNGHQLVASCAGDYGMTPEVAGLALLENDVVQNFWPAPAGFSPGSMAFAGEALWVANANGGDVYLFSTQGGRLALLRGEGGSEGEGIYACPLAPWGSSVVQDLWLKP
jgi:hypothetical protein